MEAELSFLCILIAYLQAKVFAPSILLSSRDTTENKIGDVPRLNGVCNLSLPCSSNANTVGGFFFILKYIISLSPLYCRVGANIL